MFILQIEKRNGKETHSTKGVYLTNKIKKKIRKKIAGHTTIVIIGNLWHQFYII